MRRRSNTAIPREGFSKLHHWDFVSVAGQISRRKLERLVLRPYQMAVLCWGILQRADRDEVENTNVHMGMEYAGAVGTMVIDTGDKNPYTEPVYAEHMVVPCPEY